jgi:hypothetical protein
VMVMREERRKKSENCVRVCVDKQVNDSATQTGHMTPKYTVTAMRYLGVSQNCQVLELHYS